MGCTTSTQTIYSTFYTPRYQTVTSITPGTFTTAFPLPFPGDKALTGSILGSNPSGTVFAIQDCEASSCVYSQPITVTAAHGTYHLNASGYWELLGENKCLINEGEAPLIADCTWTVGRYDLKELRTLGESWIATPAATSTVVQVQITNAAATLGTQTVQAFPQVTYVSNVTFLSSTITATSTSVSTTTKKWCYGDALYCARDCPKS